MLLKFQIITLISLTAIYIAQTNALDLQAAGSLFSTKVLKCYKCSSLLDDDCKNKTLIMLKHEFMEDCAPGAQGCVKQFVKTHNGKNATFRECYYGSISSFYTNFDCENMSRNRQYDEVECYKCKGDLCNNSNRLKHSTYGIMLHTLMALIMSCLLRM